MTATAYTVVGVMNKTLTVLANALVWDKHASAVGLCSLTVCLAGGTLYQQAPMRKDRDAEPRYVPLQQVPPPVSRV